MNVEEDRHPLAEDGRKDENRAEQDVHDSDHGVITTPSPKYPGSDDSADLKEGARVEGDTVKP